MLELPKPDYVDSPFLFFSSFARPLFRFSDLSQMTLVLSRLLMCFRACCVDYAELSVINTNNPSAPPPLLLLAHPHPTRSIMLVCAVDAHVREQLKSVEKTSKHWIKCSFWAETKAKTLIFWEQVAFIERHSKEAKELEAIFVFFRTKRKRSRNCRWCRLVQSKVREEKEEQNTQEISQETGARDWQSTRNEKETEEQIDSFFKNQTEES